MQLRRKRPEINCTSNSSVTTGAGLLCPLGKLLIRKEFWSRGLQHTERAPVFVPFEVKGNCLNRVPQRSWFTSVNRIRGHVRNGSDNQTNAGEAEMSKAAVLGTSTLP